MKIAVWYNLRSGGAKRALYYQIKGLVERGHVIEAWCPETADRSYLPLNNIIKEHVLPLTWKQYKTDTLSGKIAKYLNVKTKINNLNNHCKDCAKQINNDGFDVLFSSGDYYLAAPMIARHVKCPSLIYLQEPIRAIYEFDENHPFWGLPTEGISMIKKHIKYLENDLILQGYRVKAREEYRNVKAFDKILVNSYFSHESVMRSYGLESDVCYLGIDALTFSPMVVEKGKNIVVIGSISPNKRPDMIIKAMSYLRDLGLKLTWIGNFAEEGYFRHIKLLAEAEKVDIEFKININDKEIVDILSKSLALVYAPKLEPFGFVPLEANACGIPVVGIKEGGLRETIVNGVNGLLAEPEVKDLANTLRKIIEDKDLYENIAQNARGYVLNNWSWVKSIDCLEAKLQKLVNERQTT